LLAAFLFTRYFIGSTINGKGIDLSIERYRFGGQIHCYFYCLYPPSHFLECFICYYRCVSRYSTVLLMPPLISVANKSHHCQGLVIEINNPKNPTLRWGLCFHEGMPQRLSCNEFASILFH
jgi:hypothetical protein